MPCRTEVDITSAHTLLTALKGEIASNVANAKLRNRTGNENTRDRLKQPGWAATGEPPQ